MKTLITRDMVAEAIKKLHDAGQKPTLQAIHAALGGKGSLTTLIKLKAEIDQATTAPQDSAEGLTQFRALWAAAVAEGRRAMEAQIAEIRAGLDALTSENERLEAAAIADAARMDEILAQRDKLVDELSQANRAATEARAGAADASGRLAAALAEVAQVRAEYLHAVTQGAKDLAAARDLAHSVQIERATLTEKLAAAEARCRSAAETNDKLSGDLGRIRDRCYKAEMDKQDLAAKLAEAEKAIAALSKSRKGSTPKA